MFQWILDGLLFLLIIRGIAAESHLNKRITDLKINTEERVRKAEAYTSEVKKYADGRFYDKTVTEFQHEKKMVSLAESIKESRDYTTEIGNRTLDCLEAVQLELKLKQDKSTEQLLSEILDVEQLKEYYASQT